jgi:predicted nucleotidyltransferase
MVDLPVVEAIKRYLAILPREGIHPSRAVLFGSFARGEEKETSDIDLIVIAPEFDAPPDRLLIKRLWIARGSADTRIEPIPCGEKEWQTEQGRPILDVARRDGVVIGLGALR